MQFLGVILITSGSVISGLNDLTFDPFGYFYILLANIATTAYLQISNRTKQKHPELTGLAQSYYNSVISLPFIYICAIASEEHIYIMTHSYS